MLKRQKRESEQGEEKAQGRKKLDSWPPFRPAVGVKLLTPTATGEGASVGEEEAVFSTAPPRTIAKAQFPPRETNAGKKGRVLGETWRGRGMDARNQNSNGADAADVFPHFLFPFSPFFCSLCGFFAANRALSEAKTKKK